MIEQVEVVYFLGCPNAGIVIETLRSNKIPFESVVQDYLSEDNPRRALSSPSVLVNGVQVIGSVTTNGCASCTVFDISPDTLVACIRSALSGT